MRISISLFTKIAALLLAFATALPQREQSGPGVLQTSNSNFNLHDVSGITVNGKNLADLTAFIKARKLNDAKLPVEPVEGRADSTAEPDASDSASSADPEASDPASSADPGTSDAASSADPGTSDAASSADPGTSDAASSADPDSTDSASTNPGASVSGSTNTGGSTNPGSENPTEPTKPTTTTEDGDDGDDGSSPNDDSLSGGAIAGIVIGSIAGVCLIGGGVYYLYREKKFCFE